MNPSKFVLALLLMAFPAGSFAGMQTPLTQNEKTQARATAASSPSSGQSNGQMSMPVADEVRHQLLMLSNYGVFDWLECEINSDRTAILRGQVTRPTLKSDAEYALRKIEAIPDVKNEIETLPISPTDDQIRVAVYRSIFKYEGALFKYATQVNSPIHIIVNNGKVTLKGVVDNEQDRQLAYMSANGISGVFDVKNELRVVARG